MKKIVSLIVTVILAVSCLGVGTINASALSSVISFSKNNISVGDTVTVTVDQDNIVSVEDNGRGMPTGVNEKTGKSTIETIFTVLHAGGKFGGGAYKVSGGLHGVGASVVNALSQWLEVTVFHEGKAYFVRFENGGHAVEPLKEN